MRNALTLLAAAAGAAAFTFNTSTPTQCEDWTITWDGGTAPFYMLLVPTHPTGEIGATAEITYGRIQNISLPATGSPPYSHTFKLEQPTGLEFAVVLSDASGWGSGGASDILRVKISQDPSCLSTLANLDFGFWTEPVDLPRQCAPMRILWNNDNVTYPVGAHGFVPGGSAWDIPVSQDLKTKVTGQVDTNWTVNIESGTRFILLMSDAGKYGTGGSSPPITVQFSGNDSCMSDDSPRSTVGLTPTASPVPSSSPSGDKGSSGGSNIGAIVGAVVGVVVGLALLIAAIWLFCRRRKRSRVDNGAMRTTGTDRNGRRPHSNFEIDVFEGRHPDDARSDVDPTELDPHMTPFTYEAPPTRNSLLSTESSGSYPNYPLPPGPPVGRGQFGEKDMIALSRAGSSAAAMSESSGTGRRRFEDLQTVSEMAIDSANTGRPVDREALLAFLDPPPTYNPFDMHVANPDEAGDRTSRTSGSTDARPTSMVEAGAPRTRPTGAGARPDGQ